LPDTHLLLDFDIVTFYEADMPDFNIDAVADDWVVQANDMTLDPVSGTASVSTTWISSDINIAGICVLTGKVSGSQVPDSDNFSRVFSTAECAKKFSLKSLHGRKGFADQNTLGDNTQLFIGGVSKQTGRNLFRVFFTNADPSDFAIRGIWLFKSRLAFFDD
jgi:hypothetical protein